MKKQIVIEVTLAEARKALVDFWVQTIINDPKHIAEKVASGEPINGKNSNFIPDVSKLTDLEVAERYGEFNLGEPVARAFSATQVVVPLTGYTTQVTGDTTQVVVFDAENVHPSERYRYYPPTNQFGQSVILPVQQSESSGEPIVILFPLEKPSTDDRLA